MDSKTLTVLLGLLGAISLIYNQTQTHTEVSDFESWKAKHSINFESQFEDSYRQRIFLENVAKVNLHNLNEHNTYTMGINQFSALTDEEFVQTYLGTIVPKELIASEENTEEEETISVGDIDWVSQGAVTRIKNQGQCGSCWAFSATGGLEGLSKLAYGTLESFSEQQLVDCSTKYGNHGCNGGLMDNAFKFVKAKGIVHEDDYPYVAKQQTCKIKTGPFKISGFTDIRSCSGLSSALTGRPISVAVDASNWSRYSSGVFNNCQTNLNHGVLLVGMSSSYWVVKNSWGASWGMNGFIHLSTGNTCGICNIASYPNK